MIEEFKEAAKAVQTINEEIADFVVDPDSFYELELCLTTNGSEVFIEFIGIQIWCSEVDERDYLDEENDIREPLIPYLRSKISDRIALLAKVSAKLKNDQEEWRVS